MQNINFATFHHWPRSPTDCGAPLAIASILNNTLKVKPCCPKPFPPDIHGHMHASYSNSAESLSPFLPYSVFFSVYHITNETRICKLTLATPPSLRLTPCHCLPRRRAGGSSGDGPSVGSCSSSNLSSANPQC